MNEKILKAIKSLKDEIDSLKQEKKEDLDLELIKEKITKMIQGYHIKDKHWYYDNFDTGIVAEGKEGPVGPKGEPFRFEDFTPEQLLLLMGAQGEPGRDGRDGKDGKDGKDGRDGNPGRDGKPGENGADGITPEFVVRSVKHVPTQTPPKFEMEKIDNTYYIDIEIPRGKVGSSGKDGIDGSTPRKGIDYFTQEDIDYLNNFYVSHIQLPNEVRSVRPITSTSTPTTLSVNTIYDLGIQTELNLNLPAGVIGDFIEVDFLCDVATNLTITSTSGLSELDLVPEAGMIYSLFFDWGRIDETTYGWRISYAEYVRAEV